MTLVKWNPRRICRTDDDLNNLFEDFLKPFDEFRGSEHSDWRPSADIAESESSYEVSLELPGVKQEDIEVNVENNTLTISGKRPEAKQEQDKQYHRLERSHGSFTRSFALSTLVDSSKIKAAYTDGILTVHIPKAEAAKKKVVKVETA